MRESLFAILGDLSGVSFLDLFSGSGVVAIEAASRGAEPVVLVEKDYGKSGVLRQNIAFVESEMKIFMMPVERFINRRKKEALSFDIIYLDPPFIFKNKAVIISGVVDGNLLNPGGGLIIHLPAEENLPDVIGGISLQDKRKYGRSTLMFYK
nr:16S rRNA (guanine(966)-N(2))-methyltransferase RsmD [Spirochaeta sp.]